MDICALLNQSIIFDGLAMFSLFSPLLISWFQINSEGILYSMNEKFKLIDLK